MKPTGLPRYGMNIRIGHTDVAIDVQYVVPGFRCQGKNLNSHPAYQQDLARSRFQFPNHTLTDETSV